jgi:hypothetical protein
MNDFVVPVASGGIMLLNTAVDLLVSASPREGANG